MKRGRFVEIVLALLICVPVPLWAAPVDTLIGSTTLGQLGNANETTVERWLESILNLKYDDPSVNLIYRDEYYFSAKEYKELKGWDPESSSPWIYAVVKYGTNISAYRDEGDHLLTIGPFGNGISNVTFFGNGIQVSEPITLILLGLGLLGLGAVRRRKL